MPAFFYIQPAFLGGDRFRLWSLIIFLDPSPVLAYEFSAQCRLITVTPRQPIIMVGLLTTRVLTLSFPLRKKLEKSMDLVKNRTHVARPTKTCVAPVDASRDFILFLFSERAVWGVGGGVCCQTFSFVLFSLFSRPRAGLTIV